MNPKEDKLNNIITADVLNSKNTPLTLPETPKDTTAENIINNSQNTSIFDIEKSKAEQAKTSSETDYTKLLESITGEQAKLGTYQDELGRAERQKQLDDINQSIYTTSRNFKNYTEDLYKNPNIVGNVRGRRISDEQRRVATTLADMEFVKASIEGNLERMQQKAQEKVNLAVAPLKAKAEVAKLVLEKNFDNLTEIEKSRLSDISKKAENEVKKEEERLTKGNEMIINALQSKAPQSIISKAQEILNKGGTRANLVSVLGDYSMSPDEKLDKKIKEAQLANIYSQIEERRNPTLSPAEQIKQNEVINQEKTKIDTFSNVALLANKLLNNPKLPRAVGLSTYTVVPGTEAFDFKSTANQLINTLAAANLDKMKGAMSDKDIQFLRNIESNLSLGMSEKGFKDELTRIMTTVTNKLKNDYGVDFKINMSDLSNDELINLPIQNEDNATFFNNL